MYEVVVFLSGVFAGIILMCTWAICAANKKEGGGADDKREEL
jgi:hypothetical protein